MNVSIASTDLRIIIVKIEVSDTGIGIPEEKQDAIFEKFNRLKPSYKESTYTGKGLGLNLVKRYVEELEGEVRLVSELGRGTTFTILIPYRRSLLQATEQ
jgi:signal transduction histidine kinase